MKPGARTPEELETLFEDAFVTRDGKGLGDLFEEGAVLVAGGVPKEARGGEEIARVATAMWERDYTYLADPQRVLQAHDTALVVAERGINVLRRGTDGSWRYAIALLEKRCHDGKGGTMSQGTNQARAPRVFAVRNGEGEALWWFGALAEIKATAADTGGQMTILEVTEPPGAEAPLHVHHREDEAFWVLEGDVTFEVGGTTIEATAGDFAFGPRDVPHRFTVGENGCRMLFILTPGGFEGLVRDMSEPASSRALPPALADEEPDMEQIQAIAVRNGCELLG